MSFRQFKMYLTVSFASRIKTLILLLIFVWVYRVLPDAMMSGTYLSVPTIQRSCAVSIILDPSPKFLHLSF